MNIFSKKTVACAMCKWCSALSEKSYSGYFVAECSCPRDIRPVFAEKTIRISGADLIARHNCPCYERNNDE